ncbi:MAG TPA: NAD(P)-dependent alcohol dehydrogenase [Oculatellaceae cyanobacterium]
MGTGGVSIFALQLAKQLGARVISTTSSAQKSDWLKAKGATATINYKEIPDWAEEVRKDTGQRGVDRVVEVGGPSTINQSLKSVAIGGEIVLIGFLSEQNPGIDYFALKGTKASLRSIAVGDRDNLESVVRAIDQTGLKPVIDSVHQFSEAKKAFELLEQRKHIGKIVIKVSESQMEPV